MGAQARHGGNSRPPKKYPALILVPTGETIMIDGKRWRCLRIERESCWDDHNRNPARYGLQPALAGKPGRPRKVK